MGTELVTDIMDRVALRTNDPEFRRTTLEQMLMHYNATVREVASMVEALEKDVTFDVTAGTSRYAYPADMVVMTGLSYYPDPVGDPNRFWWLQEVFNDEQRLATQNNAGNSGVPAWYRARRQWVEVGPIPTDSVNEGFLISYIHIPAKLTIFNVSGAALEFPDFMAQYVEDGMIPRVLRADREHVAADRAYTLWKEQAPELRTPIEDRSRDRRSAIRTPGNQRPYAGMT